MRILEELRYRYKCNYVHNKAGTPVIMGTLVKSTANQELYERPLKMMRAEVFSMLSISQCKEIFDNPPQIKKLK